MLANYANDVSEMGDNMSCSHYISNKNRRLSRVTLLFTMNVPITDRAPCIGSR